MLSKNNKILIGCLALLLVMSVGYALFSDTITINATATAKGDFSYEITTMKGIDADIKTNNMYAILNEYGVIASKIDFGSEEGVANSSISNTKNTITFSASLANQGESQYFTAKITNAGSIPLVLDIYYDFSENATITGNLIMNDGILFDVNKIKDATQGAMGSEYGFDALDIGSVRFLRQQLTSLQDVYVPKSIYDELNSNFDAGIDALPIVETGESIYLVFSSSWDNGVNFSKNVKGLDVTGTNTITLPIKQYTAS